jgi:NDP-sugar pyrophosphorylase family protein
LLKNEELFTDLASIEHAFFKTNELNLFRLQDEPWETLKKVIRYLEQQRDPTNPTPWEHAPSECKPGDETYGTFETFGSVHIRGGDGLKSDENTKIKGPVILGKGVTLRKGAVITGPCLIGEDVTIGVGCRIKHSILLPNAHIVYGSRVSYSVVGRSTRVGAKAASEEEDFDGSRIPSSMGFDELGYFAGDDTWIGAGAVLSPGVCLAKGTRVQQGALLDGTDYRGKVYARAR